jgi:sugar fermentation stimulation protein A
MLCVKEPGSEVWLSPARNPDRKLRYTWELIKIGNTLVGINTARPNGIVEEAILEGKIPELKGYASLRREVRYGQNSRIDILLEDPLFPACYVEVKSVTLKRETEKSCPVEFPDSVTSRGAKHLIELSDMIAQGYRSVMFYVVQRQDGDTFTIAADIDPAYKAALDQALKVGVEVLCYGCTLSTKKIEISKSLKLLM